MRLATIRDRDSTAAVRIDGGAAIVIDGALDVGTLLEDSDWRARAESASGSTLEAAGLDFAPLVPRPDKIVCVGLNYRNHILEMGRELPEYPTLFAKYRSSLIGAHDDIELHRAVKNLDWEAELAVIIGTAVRDADASEAASAIAGYSVLNDVTARDWQNRTLQWLQGKTFERSTPIGPSLVTSDEFAGTSGEITCVVNDETVQRSDIADLVFGPVELVSYISTILTLLPGDIIATGTPGGVGAARTPPRFLAPGDVVGTRVEGVGELQNTCRAAMSDTSELDEELVTRLGWLHSGTRFFEAQLAQLSDADLVEPSRLPGWTRRHVLSHLANNATALMNLLDWARTGVENPMYESREQRAADIESGSQRPAAELRTEAITSADRLAAAMEAMPRPAWAGTVRTALGASVTGFDVPWMRVREVWVHGVDLGASAMFADIDPVVTLALLDEAVRSLAGRADCPPVRIVTDRGDVFGIGPMGAEAVDVRGTTTAVAAWVLGRSGGSDLIAPTGLPALPTWL